MNEQSGFDVVVLGGGPGGYTAAFRAADLGLSVCLVEQRERLGGVCLNVGCIPSKTLLHAAEVIEEAAELGEYGVTFGAPQINVDALLARKNTVIDQLTSGLDTLCSKRKITRLNGRGVVEDRSTVVVTGKDGEHRIQFKDIIIATGSRPFSLPGVADDPRIWDSTRALEINEIPKRLLIIGGGIIGLEMAQIYSALGSEITIIEMLDQLIPPADKDLVQPLFMKLKNRYKILTATRVTGMVPGENSVAVTFEGKKESGTGEFDAVLVAVGRRPNSAEMGFDKVGLQLDERGFVTVNDKQRTSVAHFYAIGDVVGEPMLAHKAVHEGKVAAEVIAGHVSVFCPMTIPSVAYTNPEIAWMGMTEKEAKGKKIDYDKGKFPWGASGRALSAGVSAGVCKVLFDKESGRILGAGICGKNAGELIHEAVLALEMGATAEDISLTVHAHPTLAETFAFAAEIVDGSITDLLPPKKK
ncbi:dihydrolipoyl dehydrogenase [Desulforhopalus singaporensis]|uniref:Dihydrolipoyl dehydrogenase n=1 Tax=Desulforhopalus singaporensis TaxID=91360 RepID=A0A1H0LXP9_9BACT|nr:dihydrolipoyl dehydrogenase [Desulforhopalus singaporensis]SDO73012.1 dihydrolipoamide dehydrogenase [Desulforhopalus singaporensis]